MIGTIGECLVLVAVLAVAACWVLDGIHGAALANGTGGFDLARVEATAIAAGLRPIATLPRLVW